MRKDRIRNEVIGDAFKVTSLSKKLQAEGAVEMAWSYYEQRGGEL